MGEVSIFCSALVGAGLGFLWFNAPTSKNIYGRYWIPCSWRSNWSYKCYDEMGVLAIAGGLFVLEAVSVIIQVLSFKLTGKEFLKWPLCIIILNKKGGLNLL